MAKEADFNCSSPNQISRQQIIEIQEAFEESKWLGKAGVFSVGRDIIYEAI